MAKKIEDIRLDLQKFLDGVEKSVNDDTATAIGFTVVSRMKQFISQGISPIDGFGRFPEYKAASGINAEKTNLRSQRAQLRAAKHISKSVGNASASASRNRLKVAGASARVQQSQQRIAKLKQGYPYSVQKKFPDKRARPVNLFLSGKFLSALVFDITQTAKRVGIVVGYFDEDEAKKEKGHREGANGQPKRPTIPTGSQKFNQTIELDIMNLIKQAIQKALKSA